MCRLIATHRAGIKGGTKKCFKCGEVKSLSSFYKHKAMPDGRVNKCKECNKRDVRKNRANNIDYYREYDKGRSMIPARAKAREEYQHTEQGRKISNRAKAAYTRRNPIKKRCISNGQECC